MTRTDTFRTRPLARARLAVGALTVILAGCAGGGGLAVPSGPEAGEARGVPGFDTRTYPGSDVMAAWLEASPYRWVGYYLPAPCYTGTSWRGRRSLLRTMGWGLAVLYVGEQDWPLTEEHAHAEGDRCTRDNLSEANGREHGADAARVARAEGFGPGVVVYLDVEPVDSVSDALAAYVAGWTEGLVGEGYAPGLYAHADDAEALLAVMRDAAGPASDPLLWVARPAGFSLRRGPAESGYPAAIWQGRLDVDETWGGTTLRIDANVADRPNPSG